MFCIRVQILYLYWIKWIMKRSHIICTVVNIYCDRSIMFDYSTVFFWFHHHCLLLLLTALIWYFFFILTYSQSRSIPMVFSLIVCQLNQIRIYNEKLISSLRFLFLFFIILLLVMVIIIIRFVLIVYWSNEQNSHALIISIWFCVFT